MDKSNTSNMLPAIDKEEVDRDYLKLAQIYTAILRREHKPRRQMVIKNILKKKGNIDYKIPETNYLKTFKPNLVGCSALHLAFNAGNVEIFNDILQHGADFNIKYNDITVIHRAVEESFDQHEISKLKMLFRQYNDPFTTQDINSFIIMQKNIQQKNVSEYDNWKLRSALENSFINLILSAQIKKCDPANPRSKNGISHFHAACLTNNSKALELYLEHDVDVNETVKIDSPIYAGYKPIHFAVRYSGLEIIENLLKYKVNVNDKDGQKKAPLQILIDCNIKIVEWINAKKALPCENSIENYIKNEKAINLLIQSVDADNRADLLHLYAACTLKSTVIAESLFKKVANINDIDLSVWPGYTPLHIAAFFSMDMVKVLLKNGADIEIKDKNGITPFDILVKKANVEDIHFILSTKDAWRNIVLSDNKTLLLDLISCMDNSDKLDGFLKTIDVNAFIPVDSPLWPGYTILHLAIMFSETSKLQTFLNNITDCTDVSYKENFEICCQKQEKVYRDKILVCLRRNANMNIQDVRGWTPIHLGFRQRKMDVVKLLLNHIKNFENVTDQDNLSVLHIACAVGCKEIIEKLLTSSKDLDKPILASFKWDCNFYDSAAEDVFKIIGSTPLHIAVSEEALEIVKLLISRGANVNVKDADDLTPIHRIFALKNIWKIGNEIFNWSDSMGRMMEWESPESERYLDAMRNFEDISDTLLSSPTSKESIDSNFSIHQIPSDNTSDRYIFESGETLQQQGVDILAKQDNGSIWLFEKFKYPFQEDVSFIMTMLRQDETMKNRLKQEFGWTTLHVASSLFNVELAKESIINGIDVNARTDKNSPVYPSCSPLHILMMSLDGRRSYEESKEDYESILKLLLDNGADVTLTDLNNDSPLHRCDYSKYWHSRSFKDSVYTELLLEHIQNFDVNPINDKGLSIFHLACLKQNYRAIVEFLNRGINVNEPVDFFAFDAMYMDEFTGYTPLHLAVKEQPKSPDARSQLEIVELLLRHGADLHLEDAFGDTPLHVAAAANPPNEALLEWFASKGANIHAENVSGKTPLEILLHSRRTSKKEIEVFLNRGCRLNSFNPLSQVGYIALLIRCRIGDKIENAIEMAMACPSVNDIDDMGRTAIHNIVASYDFPDADDLDVIEYFIRYGGDIDHQDRLGRTALHVAAQFQNFRAVKGLLSSGADINLVDVNGRTAFAYTLDREMCLVDLTLDFNISVNKSLATEVFVEFVFNMQLRGVYVNEINKQAQTRAIDEFDIRINEISSSYDSIRYEKIGSTSLKLDDFMSETGAIVTYPKKSQVERREIDQFFTVTITDYRFREWRFLCKLQYRKALARPQLIELSKDAMNIILDFPLPYLCFDVIQQYLSNTDLKNLVATMP